MSPVLVFFVPPDKHGEELQRPRYAQRFYCSTCRWWVSCRKSIYPSIPRTCVPLLRHFFPFEHVLSLHRVAQCRFSIGRGSSYDDISSPSPVQVEFHGAAHTAQHHGKRRKHDFRMGEAGPNASRGGRRGRGNTRGMHTVYTFTGSVIARPLH